MADDKQTTPSEIAALGQSEPMAEIQPENVTTKIIPENVTTEIQPETTRIRKIHGLTIDPEFKGLIPPHTYSEFKALTENIKTHGCQYPLIVWKDQGILLDGHHRFKICVELGLPFEIIEMGFPSRTEAKIWIITNQRGRRNLNESQRAMLAVKLEALYSEPAKERMGTRTDLGKHLDQGEAGRSAEKAADDMGISHQTVSYAKKVDKKGIPELKMIVESGKLAVSAAKKVASYPTEVQEKIVEKVITQINAGKHPKIAAIIREIVPETRNNVAAEQLKKFKKNQEATLKLLEGITERPENLAELLDLAEKINARLKEFETKTLDPSFALEEDDVETKVLNGLKSIEDNSSDHMDDSTELQDGCESDEEAIEKGTNDI